MYQNNYVQLVYEMPKKMRKTRDMKRRNCKRILTSKNAKRVEKAYRELFMPRNRKPQSRWNFRKRFEQEFENGFMKHCMNSPHKK